MLQLIADSKFIQLESLVDLVKAVVHAAGPPQRLSASPESMENAEVKPDGPDDSGHPHASYPATSQHPWEPE